MKTTLKEQDLNIILYILDIWMNANEGHRLYDSVETLADALAKCNEVVIKS